MAKKKKIKDKLTIPKGLPFGIQSHPFSNIYAGDVRWTKGVPGLEWATNEEQGVNVSGINLSKNFNLGKNLNLNLSNPALIYANPKINNKGYGHSFKPLPFQPKVSLSHAKKILKKTKLYQPIRTVWGNSTVSCTYQYGVDPERIGMGGHSAGAATVLNAAYGIKSPVKAAFSMSPPVLGYDFKKSINSPKLPPMLIIISQFDLDAVYEGVPNLRENAKDARLEYNLVWVPGFGHFYPTGAVSLGDDGIRTSVGERVTQFLENYLMD